MVIGMFNNSRAPRFLSISFGPVIMENHLTIAQHFTPSYATTCIYMYICFSAADSPYLNPHRHSITTITDTTCAAWNGILKRIGGALIAFRRVRLNVRFTSPHKCCWLRCAALMVWAFWPRTSCACHCECLVVPAADMLSIRNTHVASQLWWWAAKCMLPRWPRSNSRCALRRTFNGLVNGRVRWANFTIGCVNAIGWMI